MFNHKTIILSIVLQLLIISSVYAQITWPQNQLLPTFPRSAATQDLIYLNGTTPVYSREWKYQAETAPINHEIGVLEGDGWLCKVGVDTPNKYMVNGPRETGITVGPNVAEFRLMTNENTSNNDTLVNLEVKNSTTGIVLATQKITRQQFTTVGSYMSFKVNFQLTAENQEIELCVYWRGTGNIKVDYVSVKQDNTAAEMYLMASLKGIVNRTTPRIFSYEGDAAAEGTYTWLQSLGINYLENKNSNLSTVYKYISEISGMIVYDPNQIHTVNLATTLAKEKNAIIVSPSLLQLLSAAPFNLKILEDLRGKFTSKLQICQTLFDNYWPNIDHRLLIGLSPTSHKASLREYATALGSAVIWLDPKVTDESVLLNKFLSTMPAGANYMGWWPEEEPGITRISPYGLTTIASDFCTNLTFHSGTPRVIEPNPMPAKPVLQNKIYVAFILSDGDNLQYVEHLMRKLWKNPDRGSVPIGWTLSPAMVDAMPGALNYYHKSATVNDNLISGPSGYGYTYPNKWTSSTALDQFVQKTEEYNTQAGFRVITIWNTITGGINANVGTSFALNAPTLLGLTAQNTGGALSIYEAKLPGRPLSCNYCTNEQAMKDHIASAATGWSGRMPRFVIIQAQPWNGVTPTSFKNVMNSLTADYVVVRPDHMFQLIREYSGLTVNPGAIEGSGSGLTGAYFNGANFETPVLQQVDSKIDFNWGVNSPSPELNTDGFSVRWTGRIQPRYSGNYTFYTTSDNGCKVWINDQLIIDCWTARNSVSATGTIQLSAGQKYSIKMEYNDSYDLANCKLEWASPFQSREVVPQSQLYPDNSPNAVKQVNGAFDVKIYPVPATQGFVNIEMNEFVNSTSQLTVYDICGRAVMTQPLSNTKQRIDISSLSRGIYTISVKNGNNTRVLQYIIN